MRDAGERAFAVAAPSPVAITTAHLTISSIPSTPPPPPRPFSRYTTFLPNSNCLLENDSAGHGDVGP